MVVCSAVGDDPINALGGWEPVEGPLPNMLAGKVGSHNNRMEHLNGEKINSILYVRNELIPGHPWIQLDVICFSVG